MKYHYRLTFQKDLYISRHIFIYQGCIYQTCRGNSERPKRALKYVKHCFLVLILLCVSLRVRNEACSCIFKARLKCEKEVEGSKVTSKYLQNSKCLTVKRYNRGQRLTRRGQRGTKCNRRFFYTGTNYILKQ